MENFDTTAFINMVDAFYNNAFNNLILFGGLFVVIVTIIMPIVLQLLSQKYQSGEYIKMENNLRKEFTHLIESKILSIKKENKDNIEECFNEKEEELKNILIPLEKRLNTSLGLNLHTIGNMNTNKKDFLGAIGYYAAAGKFYLEAEDEMNLDRILKCIKNSYRLIDEKENNFEVEDKRKKIEEFISKVEDKYNYKYNSAIHEIRKVIFNQEKKINEVKF
ncbi:MAG: hypothetical protein JW870_14830 [Candidatus Delongbacteria bacterium]|nr:hypothetical protein [Candidatus Delongbacteria bacterium]